MNKLGYVLLMILAVSCNQKEKKSAVQDAMDEAVLSKIVYNCVVNVENLGTNTKETFNINVPTVSQDSEKYTYITKLDPSVENTVAVQITNTEGRRTNEKAIKIYDYLPASNSGIAQAMAISPYDQIIIATRHDIPGQASRMISLICVPK